MNFSRQLQVSLTRCGWRYDPSNCCRIQFCRVSEGSFFVLPIERGSFFVKGIGLRCPRALHVETVLLAARHRS